MVVQGDFAVDPANPLLAMDNVIVTPHALCWTDECERIMGESVLRSIQEVAAGKMPANVVNPEAGGPVAGRAGHGRAATAGVAAAPAALVHGDAAHVVMHRWPHGNRIGCGINPGHFAEGRNDEIAFCKFRSRMFPRIEENAMAFGAAQFDHRTETFDGTGEEIQRGLVS